MTTLEPEQAGQLTQKDDQPEHYDPVTVKVQGYWWMAASCILFIGFMVTTYGWINEAQERANNVKTVLVKVFPDGHSVVEPYEEGQDVEVWPQVINTDIKRWMTRRHRRDPARIENDYVYSAYFLSPKEYQRFIGKDKTDFNAYDVIAETIANKDLPIIDPKVTAIRHIDYEAINVNELTGSELVETQAFIDLHILSPETGRYASAKSPIEKIIVTISWRINPQKRERASYSDDEAHLAALFENPIGIEILDYEWVSVNEGNQ